jgi:hypothetical protein
VSFLIKVSLQLNSFASGYGYPSPVWNAACSFALNYQTKVSSQLNFSASGHGNLLPIWSFACSFAFFDKVKDFSHFNLFASGHGNILSFFRFLVGVVLEVLLSSVSSFRLTLRRLAIGDGTSSLVRAMAIAF